MSPVDLPGRRTFAAAVAWVPPVLVTAGILWAALALFDPTRAVGAVAGPALAAAGLAFQRLLGRPLLRLLITATFALAYGVGALSRPEFLRADFSGYYAWLRSAAFDRDLDFANEWNTWGYVEMPLTTTGHRYNQHTVGPALLWSPFFLLAHLYVKADRAVSGDRYAADGYSAPYLRSAAVGTITAAVTGAWLLGSALAPLVGAAGAGLSVVGAVASSSVLFYVFVQPGMSHGATFGMAAALVWAAHLVHAAPSRRRWIVLGLLLGAVVLMRLQAVVLALIPSALAVAQLRSGRARPRWVAEAGLVAVAMFVPQLVGWQVLYGRFLRLPAGPGLSHWASERGWFEASSPRFLDVLLAADHGLFTWTPAMLVAVFGLLVALRRWRAPAAMGLAVLLATTWLNGSLADWSGSDAFGARRYDLVVPFLAFGFAALLEECRRAPLVAPALILGAFVLWNLGVMNLFRNRGLLEAAVLEDVAARQARQLRRLTEDALERVMGPAGRALAYKFFVGEYFYWNLNLAGTIDLAGTDRRYLAGGWSAPENREGPPTFRWATYPQACVRFPLDRPPQDLRTVITARAPGRLTAQTMSVTLNGRAVQQVSLAREWADVRVTLPLDLLAPGENMLCLRFSEALPEAEGAKAAAISRIQLP
jgi:hypothetical protein